MLQKTFTKYLKQLFIKEKVEAAKLTIYRTKDKMSNNLFLKKKKQNILVNINYNYTDQHV